jgi:hypothetical protein
MLAHFPLSCPDPGVPVPNRLEFYDGSWASSQRLGSLGHSAKPVYQIKMDPDGNRYLSAQSLGTDVQLGVEVKLTQRIGSSCRGAGGSQLPIGADERRSGRSTAPQRFMSSLGHVSFPNSQIRLVTPLGWAAPSNIPVGPQVIIVIMATNSATVAAGATRPLRTTGGAFAPHHPISSASA